MKKSELQKIIREELDNHVIEESIVNWMIDKAENFITKGIDSKTQYTLARIYQDPSFRKLSKNFNMSERDFLKKATSMIKNDPKKFADILAYDVKNSSLRKYKVW